jgi:anti-sigma regulatory factor (Ser/Thr protein kinase)
VASYKMTGTAPRRTRNQAPQAGSLQARRGTAAPVLEKVFDSGSLGRLRSRILEHGLALADRDAAEGMVLVAHELATNAIRHGGGHGRLRLWAADGRLWCEVSDQGPGLPEPAFAGTTQPEPSTLGGRGLWIARQMSDLTITSTTAGTTITASVPRTG